MIMVRDLNCRLLYHIISVYLCDGEHKDIEIIVGTCLYLILDLQYIRSSLSPSLTFPEKTVPRGRLIESMLSLI